MRANNIYSQEPPLKHFLPPRYSIMKAWGNKISKITGSLISIFKPFIFQKNEGKFLNIKTQLKSQRQLDVEKSVEKEKNDKPQIKQVKRASKIIPHKSILTGEDQYFEDFPLNSENFIEETKQKVSEEQKSAKALHTIVPHTKVKKSLKKKNKCFEENSLKIWRKKLAKLKKDREELDSQSSSCESQVQQCRKKIKQRICGQNFRVRFKNKGQYNDGRRTEYYERLHQKQVQIINELEKQLPIIQQKYQQISQKQNKVKQQQKCSILEEKLSAINQRLSRNQRQNKKKIKIQSVDSMQAEVPKITFTLDKLLGLLKKQQQHTSVKETFIQNQINPFSPFRSFDQPNDNSNRNEKYAEQIQISINAEKQDKNVITVKSKDHQSLKFMSNQEKKQDKLHRDGAQKQFILKQNTTIPIIPSNNPFFSNLSHQTNLLSSVIGTYSGVNPLFNIKFQQNPLFRVPTLDPSPITSKIKTNQSQINNSDKVFSFQTKNSTENLQAEKLNQRFEPNDQSSMFDESGQQVQKDLNSSMTNGQQAINSNPNAFQSGFVQNYFTNSSNFFSNAPVDFLKSVPQVSIQKSINMFGAQSELSTGLWGNKTDGMRKQEFSFKKKKDKQKRIY